MTTSGRAWLALAAAVTLYDVFCEDGETLSEGADRALHKHPWLTRLAIAMVAGHVANAVPARGDPIHLIFSRVHAGSRASDD